MNDLPIPALIGLLLVLILLCAFFSGSETGLMTLNRYRLKNNVKKGHRGAKLAQSLLARPDRLIGMILLGNTVAIELATITANQIGIDLGGELGVVIAAIALAVLLLIFAEVMPKTVAALHPERIGIPAAYVLWPLQKLLTPVVFLINLLANGFLRLFGVSPEDVAHHSLSSEELRMVVVEASAMIPQRHQRMLLSILDLEKATVEDIMVPRNEIIGIDISQGWDTMREDIITSQHTRLPVFHGSIDGLKGVVHMRRLVRLAAEGQLNEQNLLDLAKEPYFIPEGTPLNQQLLNFQNQKRRIGFVVDEYGDIQGLVTLEDILEEVVGEFTSDPATSMKNVYADPDGSFRVTGSATIRSLNRKLGWKLPMDGPKTLNGLVLEKLENLPQPGRRVEIAGFEIEITETRANAVKGARVRPPATTKV